VYTRIFFSAAGATAAHRATASSIELDRLKRWRFIVEISFLYPKIPQIRPDVQGGPGFIPHLGSVKKQVRHLDVAQTLAQRLRHIPNMPKCHTYFLTEPQNRKGSAR
jgi:hypothetical protein